MKAPNPSGGPGERLEPVSASNRVNFDLLAEYNPADAGRVQSEQGRASATTEHPARAATSRAGVPEPAPGAHRPAVHGRGPAEDSAATAAPEAPNEQSFSVSLARTAESPLTWHYAGLAVLVLLVGGLAVMLGLDWAATDSHSTDALASKQLELKALNMETAPLRGLGQAGGRDRGRRCWTFMPSGFRPTTLRLRRGVGDLEVKSGVRLSRLQYAQGTPRH